MKPLRTRLEEARKRHGLPWEALERDYLLSWILASISKVEALRDTLVFKGGTALKKCYFGDYRFSDLSDKCALKDVTFSGPESFFPEAMLAAVEKTWKQWIGPLVPALPPYKTVIEELRPQIASLLGKKKRDTLQNRKRLGKLQ